jgi:hypothetical protein
VSTAQEPSVEAASMIVRPRAPFLAAAAGATAAALLVAAFVSQSPRLFMYWALACGAWAGQQLLDLGRIRRVEFDGRGNVVFASAQEELRLTKADVGGVGYDGTVTVGRLSMPLGRFDPLRVGRVVIVNPDGHLIAALRAGWMAIDDLAAGARFGGHKWIGAVDYKRTAFAPRPASPDPALGSRSVTEAAGDAAGSQALKAMRRRARSPLRRYTLALVVAWTAVVLISNAGAPKIVMDPLRLGIGLGVAGWIVYVGTEPLRSKPVRHARRILARADWNVADVVVLRGARMDPGVRAVVCLDPSSGAPTESWLVEPSITSRWLQEYQRRTCLIARGTKDDEAVIASEDLANVALVVKRTGLGKAPEIHQWAMSQLSNTWRAVPGA